MAESQKVDDRFLYFRGRPWATADQVIGKVVLVLPRLGLITIWGLEQLEKIWLKVLLLLMLILFGFKIS
jgi:hypothetical protein